MTQEVSSAKAVLGFAVWLASKDEPVTFSKETPLHTIAQLFNTYCRMNDLPLPSKDWVGGVFATLEESRTPKLCPVCQEEITELHVDHFPKSVFDESRNPWQIQL